MFERRPFHDSAELKQFAENLWWSLDENDWREAFAAHPKIGDKKASARWSSQEQRGMSQASRDTREAIQELNDEYLKKFGWIFIVCASGKSADEMLNLLQQRLPNDPSQEIRIAAGEQAKITQLRLNKLLTE
jgi:2-oxo-4-hydroxy-4-carboxy-5-ureidoimidazoline decarboxylase